MSTKLQRHRCRDVEDIVTEDHLTGLNVHSINPKIGGGGALCEAFIELNVVQSSNPPATTKVLMYNTGEKRGKHAPLSKRDDIWCPARLVVQNYEGKRGTTEAKEGPEAERQCE